MPNNEVAVYMEKHIKHDSPAGGNCNTSNTSSTTTTSSSSNNANNNSSTSSATREAKNSSPVFLMPLSKKVDSPLYKHQGQKWEKVFDFDKMLKQIRNAERYYLRGQKPSGGTAGYARRVQPQVQRLNSGDMHFYGMVPKKPTDVVVCDICLGIYTKMGFNNHMRLHHPQAWNTVSSKSASTASVTSSSSSLSSGASTSKEAAGGNASNKDNNQEITREISASGNPLAESTANATPTATSSANTSRHKSSKSGSSGGSSRSRSKSKHHHHHHQQQQQTSAAASTSSATSSSNAVASSSATQAATTNTEVSSERSGGSSSSKTSKKSASSLISGGSSDSKQSNSVGVPKEESATVQPISSSLPTAPKMSSAEITGLPDATPTPSASYAAKEKTAKASKRKSKNSAAAAAAAAYTAPPEINESSNSSIEFPSTAALNPAVTVTTTNSKSSKRSSRSKSGKDLKQLLVAEPPQLSELDQAVSSITGGQGQIIDAINDSSNTNSNDREDVSFNIAKDVRNTLQSTAVQQQTTQFNSIQMLQEGNVILQQQQQQQTQQLQHQNSNDNDSSMLTLDDMLDSKFIHEILNTDETEIHFDENELDKATANAAQQQQPHNQAAYSQQIPSKRMRYDDRSLATTTTEPAITGKFAAFQQQQQQIQQPFHVTNLDDIKMYTTAIDAQQYLQNTQSQQQQQHQQQIPQDRHQITTIDTLQLQQLLYQQQQQQQQVQEHQAGLNAYAVDELNVAAGTLEQQQQQYNNADVIMCSAEQLHKEGKINAADYATLTALSSTDAYGNVSSSIDAAAAAQFQVYNIPSLTDDDDEGVDGVVTNMIDSKLNNVIMPQNHYVLPAADGNDEEQLIYEITANNQVALISQQRQQQMIAEFLTQAGYDNMENVNVNINANGGNIGNVDAVADIKPTITADGAIIDSTDDLLDFDFSRLETVSSVSSSSSLSSSSSSTENKSNNIKTETRHSDNKYMSTASLPDDMFLNVYLYAGLPRPLALNSFGLVKLPQSVATTFRKNLHATRKANNSPVYSLSGGSGSPAVTTRFGTNSTNAKSTAAQSYFTALGANSSGGAFNEFSSIGSITITNQTKQNSHNDFNAATGGNVNGLLVSSPAHNANSPTTPATTGNGSRSSRPKSAGGGSNSSNAGAQSKSKHHYASSSTSSNANNSSSSSFQLPHQSQPKTIFVNTNLAAAVASNSDKFIKRSLISKAAIRPPVQRTGGTTFTAKQLSDILLHPGKDSKEKYLQLLNARGGDPQQQQQDNKVDVTLLEQQQQQQQQRLEHVKNFYDRRKKLLNASANAASTAAGGYNLARRLNGTQLSLSGADSASSTSSSPAALKQKLLRERLLRTLSDCGINSIKTNSSSPQNSGSNDILRVLA